MTALIAAVVFLVVVIGCAGAFGLALLFDRAETYPPEAAEACGCRSVPTVVGCLSCQHTSCEEHTEHTCRGESPTADDDGYRRSTPWVAGDHPKDCAADCCFEVRMQELVDAYDWDAAEKDIVRPWKGQAR